MKKLIPIVLILIAVGAGGAVFYAKRGEKEPTVSTLRTSRGSIVDAVGATGTLQAVTTVTVGTQVSGIVQELHADFNSIVKKGQVIARLDPSILETQVETAKANLTNANANLERQRVAVADAQNKLARAKELSARQLINKVDLENAEVTLKQSEAQLKSTQSSIVQAEAAVNKARVDLNHTVITAPIDGIVISRNVDRGQTVAASMSAPTLFIIAADLTKMQVNASIDESDVGRMRPGEAVTFRVDAYPTETFYGTVKQVRLNPVTVQNVVTYSTVIDVPNPELKLKPGMTANVNIEIARRDNVLRVPNAALRFRPTNDIFDALNQAMPPELERGPGRGTRGGGANAQGIVAPQGQPGTPAPAPAAHQSAAPSTLREPRGAAGSRQAAPSLTGTATAGQVEAKEQTAPRQERAARRSQTGSEQSGQDGRRGGFANMTPEERQKRMEERMAAMNPDERAAFQERMKQREAQGGGRGGGNAGNFQRGGSLSGQTAGGQAGPERRSLGEGGSPRGQQQGRAPDHSKSAATTSATTIDALFAPLQMIETRGRAWLFINKQLKPVSLRLGISDGTYTEVLNDTELQPETEVVTSIVAAAMATGTTNSNNANNPLLPSQRGRVPGGTPGGAGRGGGR